MHMAQNAAHDSPPEPGRPRLTRRAFLRTLGGGAGLAAAGSFLPITGTLAGPAAGLLVVGAGFVIKSLDPGRTIETTSEMINHATYDSLVTFEGEDLKTPRPSLATEWKVSGDGRTYTFALRPNVRFASGNPFTSTDVKWSLDRVMNLKSSPLFFMEQVEAVLAPDPRTAVIRLKAVQPSIIPILSSPSLGILDSKLVIENGGDAGPDAKDKDKAESYLNAHSAGSGPYILTSYVPDQLVILVKNPNYWHTPARIERIVLRNITEPATQQLQLEKGDLDVALALGHDQVQALRRAAQVTIRTAPVATSFTFMMNKDPDIGGPFANPKVQQAVRYGLDYDGIMAIAGPGAVRLAGTVPVTMPGALDPKEAWKTDRKRAQALLKESGVGDVKGRLTFMIDATVQGVPYSVLAQKIQADLSAVGMAVELNGLPRVVGLQQYRDGKAQLWFSGWVADYPDPSNFLVYLPGRVAGKRARWLADSSPQARELARLGDEAEAETNPSKRIPLLQKVQRTLVEIGPFIPLFQPAIPLAYRSNVQGVMFHSVWGLDFYPITKT
jgi:peptide/nickel transport system substrate-binding protein